MSYWKCTKAEIRDDGLAIEISFKDQYSCSQQTICLPTEIWKDIMIYESAHRDLKSLAERIMNKIQFSLSRDSK